MMMRMLASGGMEVLIDGIRQADEDNLRGYYEYEAVKKTNQDASWLVHAEGRAVKMVYRLLYDLPAAHQFRVLVMRRRMSEILRSQRTMLERQGRGKDVIPDEQMEQVFERELTRFLDWLSRQTHLSALEVDYNRVLAQPEEEVRRVNEFLGGQLDTRAMCQVVEPDLYRNR